MSIFSKIFHKTAENTTGLEVNPPSAAGYIGEAENLANVVDAGVKSKNFSAMSRQLTSIASPAEKNDYVFDSAGILGPLTMTVCFVTTTLLYIYFLFIGSVTAFSSADYKLLGILTMLISAAIIAVNVVLLTLFVRNIKCRTRYDIYSELLGFKSMEFVEDLAVCSKQNILTVIKDLKWAVKGKLIPQGHFTTDNLVFIVSDNVYDKYSEKPAVYDRYFQQQLENRHRVKARTKRISKIMEFGEQYLKKLNGFKVLIKDKNVSHKIDRLIAVVSMIFHEIDVNPNAVNSLGVFLNYYLPTTEKLLDAYTSIAEKKVQVSNLSEAQKEISDSLITIIHSYEGILEKLYKEQEFDISSSISSMELMMKKEGLAD